MTGASAAGHTGGRPRLAATVADVQRLATAGWTDRQIGVHYGCTRETICRLRAQGHIATPRSRPATGPIWALPVDVEAAWDKLLGVRRFEDVAPGRKWSLTGPIQTGVV